MIPSSHPRYTSLKQRELLVKGFKAGATALEGLIAFGRGEAFDYLLGEKTPKAAFAALDAAATQLLTAENPVLSVNGNTAVLCPEELVKLADMLDAKLEINLFHRTDERVKTIEKILKEHGAEKVYGVEPDVEIKGLESERRKVDRASIYSADVVFVALEDGDRTEALVGVGKKVVAVDLNPLSRTARTATITIVDNVVRAMPLLIQATEKLKMGDKRHLKNTYSPFDNKKNLEDSLSEMIDGLQGKDFH
ncbi:MAG: 4-phosphopantoate--beta-alanine ligase [Candidatus Hydrothermarchaeales archaeon]